MRWRDRVAHVPTWSKFWRFWVAWHVAVATAVPVLTGFIAVTGADPVRPDAPVWQQVALSVGAGIWALVVGIWIYRWWLTRLVNARYAAREQWSSDGRWWWDGRQWADATPVGPQRGGGNVRVPIQGSRSRPRGLTRSLDGGGR